MGERDTITGNARNAATVGAQRTGRGYLREWYITRAVGTHVVLLCILGFLLYF